MHFVPEFGRLNQIASTLVADHNITAAKNWSNKSVSLPLRLSLDDVNKPSAIADSDLGRRVQRARVKETKRWTRIKRGNSSKPPKIYLCIPRERGIHCKIVLCSAPIFSQMTGYKGFSCFFKHQCITCRGGHPIKDIWSMIFTHIVNNVGLKFYFFYTVYLNKHKHDTESTYQ